MQTKFLLSALTSIFAATSAAPAAVIYSNLNTDPTNLYGENGVWELYGPVNSDLPRRYHQQAMPFTIPDSSAFTVTQIDVPIYEDLGGNDAVQLTLAADAKGMPGATIGSWTVPDPLNWSHMIVRNCCELVSLILPDRSTSVSAGSTYWLIATPVGQTAGLNWSWNNTGASAQSYSTDDLGNWIANGRSSTLAAFDVIGEPIPEPVPEPASALIALTGLLGLASLRRRIRS